MLKLFFVFSTILIMALLMTGLLPRLNRPKFAAALREVSNQAAAGLMAPTAVLAPVTSSQAGVLAPAGVVLNAPTPMPGLAEFTTSLLNGQNELVGVYVPYLFALPIIQQPQNRPDFVSSEDVTITEFSLPRKYGSTGLLAHNYLSGQLFYSLKPGQEIILIYGNRRTVTYRINYIEEYQALSPDSPMSDFIDLVSPDHDRLNSSQLFHRIYGVDGQLIFQTCIEATGEPSWGRLFVIAEPASVIQSVLPTIAPLSLN